MNALDEFDETDNTKMVELKWASYKLEREITKYLDAEMTKQINTAIQSAKNDLFDDAMSVIGKK